MNASIFIYAAMFAIAAAAGFAVGAGLHRAVIGPYLLDLDGDVQSLRIRVTEAKGLRDGG